MASYDTLYNILQQEIGSARLWRQTFVAMLKASADIKSEASNTSNHSKRLVWAASVENEPGVRLNEMKFSILQNATLQNNPDGATDADVQFVVNSLIDQFALLL